MKETIVQRALRVHNVAHLLISKDTGELAGAAN